MAEVGDEGEQVGQPERPVMVEVVPLEPVQHGCLGRHRAHGRMGVDQPGGGVEARIAHPPLAHPAVVTGDVLEQPGHRIVGVGAFVHPGPGPGVGPDRGEIDEGAFAHVLAAHILVHEYEALPAEPGGGAQVRHERPRAVGSHPVRGALHEEREAAAALLRGVDGREQPDPVPHGNQRLLLGVVGGDVVQALGRQSHGHNQGQRQRRHPVPGSHCCIHGVLPPA